MTTVATKVKRGAAPQKPEDFGGPKKPALGAYFLWCAKHRASYFEKAKAKGAVSVTEVTKELADFYKNNVTEEEKKQLVAESEATKAKYQEEFNAWKLTPQYQEYMKTKSANQKTKELKAAKADISSKGMPSKSKSAYLIFSLTRQESMKKQMEAKGEKYHFTTAAKLVASEWKELSEEKKAPFVKQAAEEKAEFEKKLAEFKETDDYKEYEAKVNKVNSKAKAKVEGEKVKKTRAKKEKSSTVAESEDVAEEEVEA